MCVWVCVTDEKKLQNFFIYQIIYNNQNEKEEGTNKNERSQFLENNLKQK